MIKVRFFIRIFVKTTGPENRSSNINSTQNKTCLTRLIINMNSPIIFSKISRYTLTVLLIIFTFYQSKAQEQLIPLTTNQALINAARLNKEHHAPLQRASSVSLPLPFIDDFSKPGIYPQTILWTDSNVFINNNYGDLPVTVGVATFDGLTKNGVPYNILATQDSVADVLTSQPIDMAAVLGDTSIWMSFFYQPQGLGDVPETRDSLVLQFKDTAGTWNTIWALKGMPDTAFKRANIHVLDGKYFYDGFQFRFYNIATVNGNRDHWNLDYVILRQFGAPNDTIKDNALYYQHNTLLNEFTAMPYTHYKSLGAQIPAAMNTQFFDTLHVLDYGASNFDFTVDVSQNGTSIFNSVLANQNTAGSQTYRPYNISLNNFAYPSQPSDSVDFLVKSCVTNGGIASNLTNDTTYFTQHFHNYYAYDDGSAEWAYALTGNTDVEMAYKFDVKMQDTLVGVQIYFNPVGVDVSLKLFSLAVWSDVNVSANTDIQIYQRTDQHAGVNDSINGFKTFTVETPLVVGPGPIYVGIIQSEPATQYGIGLDRNTDSRSNMFYHLDGYWHNSNIQGSWMIRPLFGKRVSVVGVDEIAANNFDFAVYPNPASDHITIQLPSEKTFKVQVTDVIGNILVDDLINGQKNISTENFAKGMYFIRVLSNNNFSSVKKFIVD